MSVHDLVFETVSTGEVIYDPQAVTSSPTSIRVTNFGDETIDGLGLFLRAATNIGGVDNPADAPPQTDYEDLLTWGTESDLGVALAGGLKVSVPQNSGTFNGYITRTSGAKFSNKISFVDLTPGASAVFSIEFETPPGVPARRFFVDLVLE